MVRLLDLPTSKIFQITTVLKGGIRIHVDNRTFSIEHVVNCSQLYWMVSAQKVDWFHQDNTYPTVGFNSTNIHRRTNPITLKNIIIEIFKRTVFFTDHKNSEETHFTVQMNTRVE